MNVSVKLRPRLSESFAIQAAAKSLKIFSTDIADNIISAPYHTKNDAELIFYINYAAISYLGLYTHETTASVIAKLHGIIKTNYLLNYSTAL